MNKMDKIIKGQTSIITKSEDDTMELAYSVAKKAKSGDIFCLVGNLGAGKTIFAKGFARGLNIDEEITSPTFTIVNEYESEIPLYHFDCYRLANSQEAICFDFAEYFERSGVCLIEWAENILSEIPDNARFITIARISDNERIIVY